MRGRKPKPTHLKELQGNPGKRPLNKNEPKPDCATTDCPSIFEGETRLEWFRMVYLLTKSRILTELDVPALILYCNAHSRWLSAEKNLKKYGDVILSPDKSFPVQSPYLAIANKAQEQMVKIMVEFGMTPSSRSRVQIKPYHGPSELDIFIASRNGPVDPSKTKDPLEEAIQRQRDLLQAEQERQAAGNARRDKFFGKRSPLGTVPGHEENDGSLNPAERLLVRARLSRDRKPPLGTNAASHQGEGDDAENAGQS